MKIKTDDQARVLLEEEKTNLLPYLKIDRIY